MKQCIYSKFEAMGDDEKDDIDFPLKDDHNTYGDLKVFEYAQEICPD